MGKHKFNAGRVCEYCANYADSLTKDADGKFLPCLEAPEAASELPRALVQALADIQNDIRFMSDIIIDSSVPELKSNESDRAVHQATFKTDMIKLYNAGSLSNPDVIKCMVLDRYFSKDLVEASHIIAVDSATSMALVGMSYWDRYNARNGLLLYAPVDAAFKNLDVAFLVDPSNATFSLHILYDAMMNQPVATYDKRDAQFTPHKNAALLKDSTRSACLLWKDLHKKPLIFPTGVHPYRAALLWVAKRAFDRAKKSGRPLVPLTISEDDWPVMFRSLVESPPETPIMKRWLHSK